MSDNQGHQEHQVTIIVNGRQQLVPKNAELGVKELVALAFENPPTGPNILFTITYRKGGNEHHPEGTLSGSETVKVKGGTVFNVTATDKS